MLMATSLFNTMHSSLLATVNGQSLLSDGAESSSRWQMMRALACDRAMGNVTMTSSPRRRNGISVQELWICVPYN